MVDLIKLLACPKCKTKLNLKSTSGNCRKCHFAYSNVNDIWQLLYIADKETQKSLSEYDQMHRKVFEAPTDGSYEILASIAKGNLTVDIAAGDGFIEEYSPETVAVEFSKNALLNAKKKGAKYLVLADSHHLPFIDNAFDVSISSGNIEQFVNPQKAILEMARISKIQVLVVHREFDFPFASDVRKIATRLLGVANQPIEHPIRWQDLEKMLESAKLKVIYKGFWTLPVNHGQVFKFLPSFNNIPSCHFAITIKK